MIKHVGSKIDLCTSEDRLIFSVDNTSDSLVAVICDVFSDEEGDIEDSIVRIYPSPGFKDWISNFAPLLTKRYPLIETAKRMDLEDIKYGSELEWWAKELKETMLENEAVKEWIVERLKQDD